MSEPNASGAPSPLAAFAARLAWRTIGLAVRLSAALGWRTAAAACGLLAAGWIASAVPELLDQSAEAGAPRPVLSTASIAPLHAPGPEWARVQRPIANFALALPDLDGQPLRLEARRDLNSAAREEDIQAGELSSPRPHAALTLNRDLPPRTASFFVDISRRAARGGLSLARSAQPTALATKFGAVEVADVTLEEASVTRHCLAFRHQAEGVAFGFTGWLCGVAARPADRQQLACIIDRVTLLAAEDKALRAHFGKAELARLPSCMPSKLQAAGRKASWLDPEQPAPRLRGRGA